MLGGCVGHDVLDAIIILDVDFFSRYFGQRTHLFAFGVREKNIPFAYVVQGMVIKGWQSTENDFGVNDRGLLLGG
ncbi:MAG: hypothetical protein Q7K54_04810 [Candidatus Parcubacteria bacterium]|nr:hypothetical protein [Candidatus Parcubacteria bacterium]